MTKRVRKAHWRNRAQYRFDAFMARGGRSIFVFLTLVFAVVLLIVAFLRAVVVALDPSGASVEGTGFLRNLYVSFLEMSDPGSMALELNSSIWFQLVAVVAGLAGVVMLSALIAFITTAVAQRLSNLRKGHSRVVEAGHTVILGWDDQGVLEVLRELVIANESEIGAAAVVLAERDKEYMDEFLGVHLPERRTTRIVTRSGNPASIVNLNLVQIGEAKSAIVISGALDTDSEDERGAADARVIKSLLAVVTTRPADHPLNIVAELMDPRLQSMAVAISPNEITSLNSSEILAKILVQTSRSVGLSVVYNEVLSFDGAEMYFYHSDWRGATFGSLAYRFRDGVPLGFRSSGSVVLNPSLERVMESGDDVLILATDDSTIELRDEAVAVPRPADLPDRRGTAAIERELIIGWTPKGPTILSEYADYVVPGSRVDVMPRASDRAHISDQLAAMSDRLSGLEISVVDANPMDPATWKTLDPREYDNVLILGQANEMHDMARIDTETIMILIMLQDRVGPRMADGGGKVTKLIAELVESENVALATRTGVHDFVVSSRFISMLLAQVSEERGMAQVYDSLFAEEGSEIYLKPASLYLDRLPETVRFVDLMALAQARSEVCLGVKLKADEARPDRNFGVTLIPPKDTEFTLSKGDCLVVLAEDQT